MLSLKTPRVEWGKHPMETYVRSRTLEELRDHLSAERLMVTENP
jgi:hypothetical protein